MKTIDEIVHNINIGYYLDNGGEEAAVAAIEAYKDNACAEARREVELAQYDYIISQAGTITLRGYGGENKGDLKVVSVQQLEMLKANCQAEHNNLNKSQDK